MNFRYSLLLFTLLVNVLNAQNFSVAQLQMPKCYGVCDGKITFTTGAVSGPFTCTVTNNAGCPNPTLQSSGTNSITIDSICGCSGTYTFSIYNASMALVGTNVQNIINYATSPLAFNVNSITPATCSNCCDGNVTFSISGGNQMSPPSFSVDGTYTNNVNPLYFICVGNHTVCIEDASGCKICVPLYMNYNGGPTFVRYTPLSPNALIYPSPAREALFVKNATRHFVSYEISDISGRLVAENTLHLKGNEEFSIGVDSLMPGIYYLGLKDENGGISRFKFVKSAF